MERDRKLARLRRMASRVLPTEELEGAVEAIRNRQERPENATEEEWEAGLSGLDKLRTGEQPTREEEWAIEAIILPQDRPAVFVEQDRYLRMPPAWEELNHDEVHARMRPALKAVGRVEVPDHESLPYAGTGFVVGDGLLMTNRHVAHVFATGTGRRGIAFRPGQTAGVDFLRERGRDDRLYLEVRDVVLIHPFWDMALLRVESLDVALPEPLALWARAPEDLDSRSMLVIGYPAYDWRNDRDVQDRIFEGVYNVKRVLPGTATGRRRVQSGGRSLDAMGHDASTLGGNSGSAVIDTDTGDVVGLHFAGLYLESNYAVPAFELARDATVVDAGVRFRGAEGLSRGEWMHLWAEADAQKEAAPDTGTDGDGGGSGPPVAVASTPPSHSPGTVTVTIPLHVTVSLGSPAAVTDVRPAAPREMIGALGSEAPAYDLRPRPDYDLRPGFDDTFLGADHRVRLPWLASRLFRDVAWNRWATRDRHVLPYHHFSVIMCRSRRQPYVTAVNIDGRRERPIDRSLFSDKWFYDPRLPREEQLGPRAYVSNKLDRGHLVRRLDPVWGDSFEEASAAHDDTFHWTNCTPQHERVNRNNEVWLGLENYVLNNANNRDLRISVMSGPVLDDDDPHYKTKDGELVQLPLAFWKVVVMVREDDTMSATGYLVSQEDHVRSLVEVPEEGFQFGAFRTFQTTVRRIESLTGLRFDGLAAHDPLGGGGHEGVAVVEEDRPLDELGSITL